MNIAVAKIKEKSKIAVIGGGAAGLTAAYLIQHKHDVTIFEKNSYLGGHANTIAIENGLDTGIALDVGFIVFNDRNYPTLHKLLSRLQRIEICDSEMSFGYYSQQSQLHYAINWSPQNQFSQQTNLQSSKLSQSKPHADFLSLLKEILKFCRQASHDLNEGNLTELTLGQYLTNKEYSQFLIDSYIIPLGAAIWSTSPREMLDFPAQALIRFFDNHGLLSLESKPQWQYLKGGSKTYVNAIHKNLRGAVKVNTPIDFIVREQDEIAVKTKNGENHKFDYVAIATHADTALSMLKDSSPEERRLLGAWKYQINQGILHTDESVMPPDKSSWASWNYLQETDNMSSLSVTYHLNRLQGHIATEKQYFLSLNRQQPIAGEHILQEFQFTHPTYTFDAIASQPELAKLNGTNRTFFCGSYLGYGFHEDAVKSGVAVAQAFGVEL